MSQFHLLTVTEIKKITSKAVRISFKIPENLTDAYTFVSGQYVTLKTRLNGNEVRRDYSLCNTPNNHTLQVAVKQVENGTFSIFATTKLKVGDTLEVSKPNGRFTFVPDKAKKRTLAAFVAGSGITPVLSIIKTLLYEEPNSKIWLVYGNKSIDETMFFEELVTLQNTYASRFGIQFIFSQTREKDALFGRIEPSTIRFIQKNTFQNEPIDAYYLCGPGEMITTAKTLLLEQGVSESDIHFELFTPVAPATSQAISAKGETEVTVFLDDEAVSFSMPQTQTILEAALKNNIDAPYSCQGGICSTCIARLKEGKATMRQNNILTDSELAEGLILTCQAQPTTAKVVVDYDDV
ncbi:MAG TPA: 2Fe-2S iron-sulfur cluster-binding protein [Flavobacteriaceae bacterium]|nr:2Fe-2S iron-sulfur cluster-binding protein [Flavobacteriaceae bacterium]